MDREAWRATVPGVTKELVGHDLATKQHQPTKPWAWYWWFQRESKQISLVMEDRLAKLVSDLDSGLQGQGVAGNCGRLFKEGWEGGPGRNS